MPIVHRDSGTQVDAVEDGIHRISIPVQPGATHGGCSLNQFLVVDEEPILIHTGPRSVSSLVALAIESVMPLGRLRWVAFGHMEADECGGYRQIMAVAPRARPLCGRMQAMVAIGDLISGDLADRAPRVLADGETHSLGRHRVTWIDAPHVPHGRDSGFLFESSTRTLFASDLFPQTGTDCPPVTEANVVAVSESVRRAEDHYSYAPSTGAVLERLAGLQPSLVACMHGSAYRGDGAALLRALAGALRRA